MKTPIQKILPWALPILVLVFVLSGCGKDNKIHALDTSVEVQNVKATTQALRANGAGGGALSPADFSQKCHDVYGAAARIESGGTICASPVILEKHDMDPTLAPSSQEILASLPSDFQYLIISKSAAAADEARITADIVLDGIHFMTLNDRKLSKPGLRLAFSVYSESSLHASVQVWKCVNNRLDPVNCNTDILQGNP